MNYFFLGIRCSVSQKNLLRHEVQNNLFFFSYDKIYWLIADLSRLLAHKKNNLMF